jgi:LmbE family N-acetylglucosaminyl deacetylase
MGAMADQPASGFYDYIYLSPHFDDAVFSCGGQIAAQTAAGSSVLIVTVMAAPIAVKRLSDFALALHRTWGLGTEAVAIRRAEDHASCAILGAEPCHWPVLDCIYREGLVPRTWLYTSRAELFGAISPAEEAGAVANVSDLIRGLPLHRHLVVPLAVGHHVDHQVVRRAAESAGTTLCYYEDLPYALAEGAVDRALGTRDGWTVEEFHLTAGQRQEKAEAMEAHASQIIKYPQLRGDGAPAVERVWRRA